MILTDGGRILKKKKYLYKRSLIVSEVTAVARAQGQSDSFRIVFNLVGNVPTERQLKKLAREKVEKGTVIEAIAGIQSKRKILGITAEGFLKEADELDPATGQPKYYLKEKD